MYPNSSDGNSFLTLEPPMQSVSKSKAVCCFFQVLITISSISNHQIKTEIKYFSLRISFPKERLFSIYHLLNNRQEFYLQREVLFANNLSTSFLKREQNCIYYFFMMYCILSKIFRRKEGLNRWFNIDRNTSKFAEILRVIECTTARMPRKKIN